MKISTIFVTLLILFVIGCKKDESPTTTQNQKPKIVSLSANPATIKVNEESTLSCVATDPEGDDLTIMWSSDKGTFPNGNMGQSVKWKAPDTAGSYPITATASDGKDTAQAVINVITSSDFICGTSTVTYSGRTYNTVLIGSQCWFKENLDVGTKINSSTNSYPQTNNGIIEKYCYDNDSANCDIYGGLYEWTEAMQYSNTPGTRGICPPGWHIPTHEEMQTLRSAVGDNSNALKAVGQGTGSGAGTNTSGFSALLAGFRSTNIFFSNLGFSVDFWSSTERNATDAYHLGLYYYGSNIDLNFNNKNFGFSVRCVKD
jgi:uncharacterized protein (TIGR02145 family)